MKILFSPAMERESLRQIKPETFFCDKNEKRDPGNRLRTSSRPPVSAPAVRLYDTYCTNVSRGTLPPNRVVGRSHSPLALRTKECCRELRNYNQAWIISDEKDQTFVPLYFLTKYGNIYLRPGAWKVKICSIFRLINQLDIFSLLVVEETSFPSASMPELPETWT